VITLVLGGVRSGKSAVAERLVVDRLASARDDAWRVTYLATLDVGGDAELAARVARHQARRPASWSTVEAGPDLPAVLRDVVGMALIDSLGPWVSASPGMEADAVALCEALAARSGDTVVVSEEVGLAVHPSTEAGRRFQDAMGAVNQAVADCAHEVVLVVAGRTLRLDRAGEEW